MSKENFRAEFTKNVAEKISTILNLRYLNLLINYTCACKAIPKCYHNIYVQDNCMWY